MKSKAIMTVEQEIVIAKIIFVLGIFGFVLTELPFPIMKYLIERTAVYPFIHWLLQIGSLFVVVYSWRLIKRLKKYQKYPVLER